MARGKDYWVDRLQLQPHPEGGFYRETYRAGLMLPESSLPETYGGDRAASTAIYFLLTGTAFSAFHRIRSDELWHFYSGITLTIHIIEPAGHYREIRLGRDLDRGETPQAVVPAGCWFGASLPGRDPEAYALVGCTVAPGFDFADFEMAQQEELAAMYPQHRMIIEKLTRKHL